MATRGDAYFILKLEGAGIEQLAALARTIETHLGESFKPTPVQSLHTTMLFLGKELSPDALRTLGDKYIETFRTPQAFPFMNFTTFETKRGDEEWNFLVAIFGAPSRAEFVRERIAREFEIIDGVPYFKLDNGDYRKLPDYRPWNPHVTLGRYFGEAPNVAEVDRLAAGMCFDMTATGVALHSGLSV